MTKTVCVLPADPYFSCEPKLLVNLVSALKEIQTLYEEQLYAVQFVKSNKIRSEYFLLFEKVVSQLKSVQLDVCGEAKSLYSARMLLDRWQNRPAEIEHLEQFEMKTLGSAVDCLQAISTFEKKLEKFSQGGGMRTQIRQYFQK